MSETHFPRSPYDTVGGLVYFARMLDKIRCTRRGNCRLSIMSISGLTRTGAVCGCWG